MTNANFKGFANSFQAIARLGLESVTDLLNHLGNPQNDLKFIHVAGTNGKGSVCSFLQNIFTKAGHKTGRYISPNLISVCERISVDNQMISEEDLDRILALVKKAADLTKDSLGEYPTQFEIWTAAAFLYFKEKNCDMVILETGLGGTRDATNVIPPPLATVITRLDLDHTEYLGDTIEKIAAEKAGIIKKHKDGKNGLCVTSAFQAPKALKVLQEKCARENTDLITASAPNYCEPLGFFEVFDYSAVSKNIVLKGIKCGISGFYQPENASLAIECPLSLGVSPENIKEGIAASKNPARFEIISQNPLVIYDGAHNKNGMMALISCLGRYFKDWQGATFITAFMGDKDIEGTLSLLKDSGFLENSKLFSVSVKDNPRAASPKIISDISKRLGLNASAFESLDAAYSEALKIKKPIILCGSLYLYKDFIQKM